MTLKNIVNNHNSFSEKAFDLFFQILILISIICFSLETIPELYVQYKNAFLIIENSIIGLFVIEYILRVWASDKRVKFIFSFYGIIDFLAILPFIISHGVIDLRALRVFRFFKLFLVFKILRYSRAIKTFQNAFKQIKNELIVFIFTTLLIMYIASVGIYYFEHEAQPEAFKSIFHAMWWSVATLTTVGYGDIYPITAGGKFFTFIILILGLGIVSVPSALMASSLSKYNKNN